MQSKNRLAEFQQLSKKKSLRFMQLREKHEFMAHSIELSCSIYSGRDEAGVQK